jgi:hypothetical protein
MNIKNCSMPPDDKIHKIQTELQTEKLFGYFKKINVN